MFLGGNATGAPAITMTPGRAAYIAIRDPWDAYWVTRFTPGGAPEPWTRLGGIFSTDPTVAAGSDATVYVVGKDRWNGLWANRLVAGTRWAALKDFTACVVGGDSFVAGRSRAGLLPEWYGIVGVHNFQMLSSAADTPLSCGAQ